MLHQILWLLRHESSAEHALSTILVHECHVVILYGEKPFSDNLALKCTRFGSETYHLKPQEWMKIAFAISIYCKGTQYSAET